MCPAKWIILMDHSDGSFLIPLNGYLIHGFFGMYVVRITVCAFIRNNQETRLNIFRFFYCNCIQSLYY